MYSIRKRTRSSPLVRESTVHEREAVFEFSIRTARVDDGIDSNVPRTSSRRRAATMFLEMF